MMQRLMYVVCALVLISASLSFAGLAPELIHYQAVLEDAVGDPVTTETQVTFRIYDTETSKTILWEEARMVTPDENGAFSISLGEVTPLNEAAFAAAERWLGITVGTDSELEPRTRLVSSPYSFRVETIDQADAGTVKGPITVSPSEGGSGDDAGLYIQNSVGENAFSMDAAADTPMFIVKGPGGDETAITSTGVTTPQLNVQTQSAKGGGDRQCVNHLGVEQGNSAVGCENDLSTAYNSFAVGEWNTIDSGEHSVAMGSNNDIGHCLGAFVIGAQNTVADDGDRCVIMGAFNSADGYENICIGRENSIQGSNFSSILGGAEGTIISGYDNAIFSGRINRISGSAQSIICGGDSNRIDSLDNFEDEEFFLSACIGGGSKNIASSNYATISGGLLNEARAIASTVGGGLENKAINRETTVAGGRWNEALGVAATVGGGDSCIADGNYATVPGGGGNRAGSPYSFAAGINAHVDTGHHHCFVWNGNYNVDPFYTTGHQQFLINAPGGVGINTNTLTPGCSLTVEGVTYSSGGFRYPDGNVQTEAYLGGASNGGWTDDGNHVRLTTVDDSVGIGTTTPEAKLHVDNAGIAIKAVSSVGGGIYGAAIHAVNNSGSSGPGLYVTSTSWHSILAQNSNSNATIFGRNNGTGTAINAAADGSGPAFQGSALSGNLLDLYDWNDQSLKASIDISGNLFAAGNVGIGTNTPQGALDVASTTGALIVPRMTTTERDALTAVNGMIIYNLTTDQFNFYEAGAWVTK